MQPLTRQQAREIDAQATAELGIPSIVLMENAGRGVAEVLLARRETGRRVLVLCGKGNNGGDGFVIARHLAIREVGVTVALLAPAEELAGDARTNYEILVNAGWDVADLSDSADLCGDLNRLAAGAEWVVDALLGTGADGEPREPYRTAIAWMNGQSARILAVDLPSGLDCDSGQPSSATVRAELTCTFVAPKSGFAEGDARDFLGEVQVVSIGIPPRAQPLRPGTEPHFL